MGLNHRLYISTCIFVLHIKLAGINLIPKCVLEIEFLLNQKPHKCLLKSIQKYFVCVLTN